MKRVLTAVAAGLFLVCLVPTTAAFADPSPTPGSSSSSSGGSSAGGSGGSGGGGGGSASSCSGACSGNSNNSSSSTTSQSGNTGNACVGNCAPAPAAAPVANPPFTGNPGLPASGAPAQDPASPVIPVVGGALLAIVVGGGLVGIGRRQTASS